MNAKIKYVAYIAIIVISYSALLATCGFSDNIPVGLEIEREISSDSTYFPSCDARTVKMTENAKQLFLVNPNNFRMGRSGQPLEPWVKTPIPDRLLYDGDTLKSRSADIGTYCGGWFTSTIDDYNKIF